MIQEALRLFLGMPPGNPSLSKQSKLDQLSGTWSQTDEEEEFSKHTQEFGKIDPDMWQ
ncbi:MAG: hypothetical protein AAF399_21310 [Bacteroidota bacterium]